MIKLSTVLEITFFLIIFHSSLTYCKPISQNTLTEDTGDLKSDNNCFVGSADIAKIEVTDKEFYNVIGNIINESITVVNGLSLDTDSAMLQFTQTYLKSNFIRHFVESPLPSNTNNNNEKLQQLHVCHLHNETFENRTLVQDCIADVYTTLKNLSISVDSLLNSNRCSKTALSASISKTFHYLSNSLNRVLCTLQVSGIFQLYDVSILHVGPVDDVQTCLVSEDTDLSSAEYLRVVYHLLSNLSITSSAIYDIMSSFTVYFSSHS